MINILIVLGVICLQVVWGESTESQLPSTHIECLTELNLPADILLSNNHEDFTVTEGVPDFNRVIHCVYKKENFLNADDTLNIVEFHRFLAHHLMKVANINVNNPETAATNAIEACTDVQGTDFDDTLVKNYNCVINYLRKLEKENII